MDENEEFIMFTEEDWVRVGGGHVVDKSANEIDVTRNAIQRSLLFSAIMCFLWIILPPLILLVCAVCFSVFVLKDLLAGSYIFINFCVNQRMRFNVTKSNILLQYLQQRFQNFLKKDLTMEMCVLAIFRHSWSVFFFFVAKNIKLNK